MENIDILREKIKNGTFTGTDLTLYYEQMVIFANNSQQFKELVKGWDRTFHFDYGGIHQWLKIKDGALNFGKGVPESADLKYSLSTDNAIKMLLGEVDGTSLYVQGNLKIEGDLGDAQRMGGIQAIVVGEMGIIQVAEEEEVEKGKFNLTEEDNIKIQASTAKKAELFAKGAELTVKYGDPNSKYSLGLRIEEFAEENPNKIALKYEYPNGTIKEWTNKAYNEEINKFANYFLNKGTKKGDVVVVEVENRPEVLFILIAMAKIGAIASLINTHLRLKPLIHSIQHSLEGTSNGSVIVGEELLEVFEEVKEDLNLTEQFKQNLYYLQDTGELNSPNGYIDLKSEVENSSLTNPTTTPDIILNDSFAYIFTSGTTGLPKAALCKNAQILTASGWFGFFVLSMTPEDVMLITTPLYHSNALYVAYGAALSQNSTICIVRKFSASKFWDQTRRFKATCFNYVGEICRYLFNKPPKPDDADNPIKKIVGNGLRNDYWVEFKNRFDIETIGEFYGATERFIPNFANIHNLDCTVGICFTPYALVTYDLDKDEPYLDGSGRMIKCEVGEPGLLLGQIPEDSQEYFYMYKDPEATRKKVFRNVFEEGDMYINTGDLLRDIGYGHAQFVDRLGDTFRWKGENVSTEEVESVVNNFEQVEMSCSYGVLIPETEGRAGMVSVVIRGEKDFNLNEFLNMLKEYLPEYAIPKFLRVRDKFEVTGTLKIRKVGMKNEAYNVNQIRDPLFILLPGASEYIPLTAEIYDGINQNKYKF